jgi:methyl-accepting chemotaxis protein
MAIAFADQVNLLWFLGGSLIVWVLLNLLNRSRLSRRLLLSIIIANVFTVLSLYLIEQNLSEVDVTQFTILILISQLVLVVVFTFLFRQRIVKPLSAVVNRTERMTEGDLVSEIPREYRGVGESHQIIHATNNLASRFKVIVSDIKGSADQLSEAAEELAAGSEEVAATTEEVTSTIQTIAEGAAEQVRRLDEVSRILTEMVSVTEESIRQIGMTSRITLDLAEQTNLVSLNASIEAAKAAEHGEGFQVVAEHVRQLSVESKSAATTVNQIITQISNRMRESVESIINAVDKIASVAENTAASSEEAAAAAEEQSASLQEITQQAQKLAELSEKTERNIEEFQLR